MSIPLKTRLFYWCTGWLAPCLVYIAASFVTGTAWLIPESPVDRLLSFSSSGIWLYLFFYVYIPYTFLTANPSKIKTLNVSFILCAAISGLFFFILPSTIVYPEFEPSGLSSYCLYIVKTYDTTQNCFPSLHASLIMLCTIANLDPSKKLTRYVPVSYTHLEAIVSTEILPGNRQYSYAKLGAEEAVALNLVIASSQSAGR